MNAKQYVCDEHGEKILFFNTLEGNYICGLEAPQRQHVGKVVTALNTHIQERVKKQLTAIEKLKQHIQYLGQDLIKVLNYQTVNKSEFQKALEKGEMMVEFLKKVYFDEELRKIGESIIQSSKLIRSHKQFKMLSEWLPEHHRIHQKIFNTSQLQESSLHNFRSACIGKQKTLTLVQVDLNVFGGYTSKQWLVSPNQYVQDEDAFLFSLSREQRIPQKYGKKDSIYCHEKYGPVFGSGYDLAIVFDKNKSYSNLGDTYKYKGVFPQRQFLAGSYYFSPTEIEVFVVLKQQVVN